MGSPSLPGLSCYGRQFLDPWNQYLTSWEKEEDGEDPGDFSPRSDAHEYDGPESDTIPNIFNESCRELQSKAYSHFEISKLYNKEWQWLLR